MDKWNINKKPPEDICPKRFCFLWSEEDNICDEAFGICRRAEPEKSDKDLYEPCEPELDKHGLPWFYFIPNSNKLVRELREEYIKESKKLWGKD
jgi:hypothetical protein